MCCDCFSPLCMNIMSVYEHLCIYIDQSQLKHDDYGDQGSSHGGRRLAVPPGTANFRPALGFKLDAPPGTNKTKIC